MLNTVLPSALTKAIEAQEVGGILGLSTSIESFTRVIAPLLGGYMLENVSFWAPGTFGALILVIAIVYFMQTIGSNPPLKTTET
jgi:DHA1 family tetracycline resistance protein-like MFS transporter